MRPPQKINVGFAKDSRTIREKKNCEGHLQINYSILSYPILFSFKMMNMIGDSIGSVRPHLWSLFAGRYAFGRMALSRFPFSYLF